MGTKPRRYVQPVTFESIRAVLSEAVVLTEEARILSKKGVRISGEELEILNIETETIHRLLLLLDSRLRQMQVAGPAANSGPAAGAGGGPTSLTGYLLGQVLTNPEVVIDRTPEEAGAAAYATVNSVMAKLREEKKHRGAGE